jgi:antitoxin VapB
MAIVEKARVFMSGRSQAVRIPAQYRFASSEVFIRQDPRSGEITLSEQAPKRPWNEIFANLDEAVALEGGLDLDRDQRPAEERNWP